MIFPDIFSDNEASAPEELPGLTEWAVDLDTGEMLRKNGSHYLVTGMEALKIWIRSALLTVRGDYEMYTDQFGSELRALRGTTDIERACELAQVYITEALSVSPYILSVGSFDISRAESRLEISFTVSTIYGEADEYMEVEI